MTDVKKVLLVADYGKNDLAFKEVQQRLYDLAQDAKLSIQIDIVSVDPFNTAQTAAVMAQAAQDGKYDLIYSNTAPRKDQHKQRINNDGEPLAYTTVRSKTGKEVGIIGVFSGNEHNVNTFSLLPAGTVVYETTSPKDGSQFRSRDVFTPYVIDELQNKLVIKEAVLQVPETKGKIVDDAKEKAAQLLADAYENQLLRHGDVSKSYTTIIGANENLQPQLQELQDMKEWRGEVDAIPLKATKPAGKKIEAGFVAAQLALNSKHPEGRTFAIIPEEGMTLASAEVVYNAELNNGAHILTTDMDTLAFVKPFVKHVTSEKRAGVGQDKKIEREAVSLDNVTLPENPVVAYVDGYGNAKLTKTRDELVRGFNLESSKPGERVVAGVQVGNNPVDAWVSDGSFSVQDGQTALSKGSSGWGDKMGLAEVFRRGGSASEQLGGVEPGAAVCISRKRVEQVAPGTVVTQPLSLQAKAPGVDLGVMGK